MQHAASTAAALGYRVHPLQPGSKRPILTAWQVNASTDPEQVATWFGARPNAGLGLATGGGLLVLDVDGEAGRASLAALEDAHGRIKGHKVRTPSGGVHLYLRAPQGVLTRTNAGQLAAGIDLRGDGGYVVAPPTVLADGRRYRAKHELPRLNALRAAPAWLLEQARRPEPTVTPSAPSEAWADLDASSREHVERSRSILTEQQAARLDALQAAATPDGKGYVGDPWDVTVHAIACELVRIARLPASDPAAELRWVRAVFDRHAPRDQGFGDAAHARIWASAVKAVTERGEVARLGPAPLDVPEPQPRPAPPAPPEGKRSAADVVVDLALRDWRLHVDPSGDVFAVPLHDGVGHLARRLRGGKLGLRQALAIAYRRQTGRTAPQQALADALTTLEGEAQTTEPVELHQRVAEHDGALWIDLGDAAGHVIRVTDGAWSVERSAPVLFTRTELTAALPIPERGGDLADLWQHLNVPAEDQALLLAVMVAAFVPNIPHPVLDLEGEQGSGKSTLARRLVDLLDPSPVPMRKAPRDPEAFVTAASGSWVVSLDNLSALPDWLSDSLCRASTGEGDVRRQLYTDGGLSVFAFRRVVIVNGIDLAGIRGDLAERLVTVRPPRIEGHRRDERDLDAAWRAALPQQLGALLDLIAAVWGEVGEQHKYALSGPSKRFGEVGEQSEQRAQTYSGGRGEVDPFFDHSREGRGSAPDFARIRTSLSSPTSPTMRMADFARVVSAVDRVLGSDALGRYAEGAAELAADTLNASPFVSHLLTGLLTQFDGTADDLRSLLTSTAPAPLPRNWPTNARAVTGLLRRNAPALRRQGWCVTDEEDRKRHRTLWHLTPAVLGEAPMAVRCRVCGDAPIRADGLCAKRDTNHEFERITLIAPAAYREDA